MKVLMPSPIQTKKKKKSGETSRIILDHGKTDVEMGVFRFLREKEIFLLLSVWGSSLCLIAGTWHLVSPSFCSGVKPY